MISIWICEPFHTSRVFHILGESGLVGVSNHLRPFYLMGPPKILELMFEFQSENLQ